MKKFFKYALILLGIDVLLFLLLALKPFPDPLTKADCMEVSGVVSTVNAESDGDLILTLAADDKQYYLNQMLSTAGETVDIWDKRLNGKEVSLYFHRHLAPLDYADKQRKVSLMKVEGEAVWGELAE